VIVGYSHIGDAIRQARIAKGLSQDELASALSVTQATVSRAEQGKDSRLSTLIEIARALDLEFVLIPRRLVPPLRLMLVDRFGQGIGAAVSESDDFYDEAMPTPPQAAPSRRRRSPKTPEAR
jgi:transcriptional regulator with XRE-family HTH domain